MSNITYTAAGLWEQWYVPSPPDAVACAGEDPELFEFSGREGALTQSRDGQQARPTGGAAAQITAALAVCAACPLATRAWCLDSVRPQRSGVSIIAGGAVWSRGRRVWTLDDERRRERAA